ncbi:MAG: anaerobic sulfatase maturase [Desulfotignum sp.]|nr:anaerobic sulfatase maturase [Desulfotignum sp.]MCF8138665.1 anaerobic sulfatase maturase [Desulfotignum sp.]
MDNSYPLLIKPASGDCNLACEYCFYLEKTKFYPQYKRHRMTQGTLEQLIQSYMAAPQSQYVFAWQGGEPTLMGNTFYEKVTDLQVKYGHPGASVANTLQTNGTLISDELACHLKHYNFLVGVSLDGPSTLHNAYRKNNRGRGSHNKVIKGLETLRKWGVNTNILSLVTSANVNFPEKVFDYFLSMGMVFQQYIPCVEYTKKGKKQPWGITGRQWGNFLCRLYDNWIDCGPEQVSIRYFDELIKRLAGEKAGMCSMGKDCRQYLVVEHNGDIYPCDFFVAPKYRLGNIHTHALSDIRNSDLYRTFGLQKSGYHPDCTICEYLPYCGGDCKKHRDMKTSKDHGGKSYLCSGYKQFFQHALPSLEKLASKKDVPGGFSEF